ncbi:MAG: CoA-binding protein [Deltaproteobacteria bacterium]|nr:CoA-binding protein [Deltaproteobacteria bacterium]
MGDPDRLEDVRAILEETRTVAILGAHPTTWRAAFYVPQYLHSMGYRVLPCNPRFGSKGTVLWGERVLPSVDAIEEPVDLVDVFRASDKVPEHLDEILAMKPLPRVVWLQQGIRNDAFAETLRDHGITVVQDRCTLADHRSLGLGRVSR